MARIIDSDAQVGALKDLDKTGGLRDVCFFRHEPIQGNLWVTQTTAPHTPPPPKGPADEEASVYVALIPDANGHVRVRLACFEPATNHVLPTWFRGYRKNTLGIYRFGLQWHLHDPEFQETMRVFLHIRQVNALAGTIYLLMNLTADFHEQSTDMTFVTTNSYLLRYMPSTNTIECEYDTFELTPSMPSMPSTPRIDGSTTIASESFEPSDYTVHVPKKELFRLLLGTF